jgi:hypothetical protein
MSEAGQPDQSGQQVQRIKETVTLWEASKPENPAPAILGDVNRVWQIVAFTGQWPDSMVKAAEYLGFELHDAQPERVEDVMHDLFACRMTRSYNGDVHQYQEMADEFSQMTDPEKFRLYPGCVTRVDPAVNQALGYAYMIREPNTSWWIDGERRNRYVPAGDGVLFFRDVRVIEIPLQPLPKPPVEAKMWSWGQKAKWRREELAKIPKRIVTVICEYGSRRCQEGDPVLDHEGQVVRQRIAGEWIRETVAYLPGTPSPFFFDDFTGHPTPAHSSKTRAFRQEVADVAFVLMHQ